MTKNGPIMKRLLLSLTLVLTLAVPGCGTPVKNAGNPGSSIICYGDSITYGPRAVEGGDYPSYLALMVDREVINAGGSGDTTEDGLDRLETDVLEEDPYLVIIEFGANDYFKGIPKEETLDNLEEMILLVQEKGAMTALCDVSGGDILGVYDIYHKDLKRLAARTGSIFIPYLMKDIIQDASLKSDQMHPNAKGYEIVAERVYRAIEKYL
jgi:acyl-CoA thioesterase-1